MQGLLILNFMGEMGLKLHIDTVAFMIVSLCFVFQKYALGLYEKMEQVPKLVQWLISIGASVETIGPYPLHALMRLCIQASESPPSGRPPCPAPFQPRAPALCTAQGKAELSHLHGGSLDVLNIQ